MTDVRTSEENCANFAPVREVWESNGRTRTRFIDLNDATIVVRDSTLASVAAVRLYIHPAADDPTPTATYPASTHLCRAMAREVRDALDRFLAETTDDDCHSETQPLRLRRRLPEDRAAYWTKKRAELLATGQHEQVALGDLLMADDDAATSDD